MSNILIKKYNGTNYEELYPIVNAYNNLLAKGYTLIKTIENLQYLNFAFNQQNSFVFFENFGNFVFYDKPFLSDIFITVEKISGVITEQNLDNSGKGYNVYMINHDT